MYKEEHMKRLLKVSLLIFFIVILGTTTFATEATKVIVNGETLKLEEKLIVREGAIYISLRDIARALNFEINWPTDKKTVNLKNDNMIIGIQADNQWYSKKTKDGKASTFKFDAATVPTLIDGKLYVPIGNFTIVAGGRVGWDADKNIYNIIYDWQLNYVPNTKVSVYAGTGKKGDIDSELRTSQFKYAQSIYTTKDKVTYVSDAGTIRKITSNGVESLKMEPGYIKVAALKGVDNEVYALSTKDENAQKENKYGIFKLEGNTLKEVYVQKATDDKIVDFDMASTSTLCMLKEEAITGQRYMVIVNLKDNTKPTKVEIVGDISSLAAGGERAYLGSKNGSIYCYDIKAKTFSLFAGTENVHKFQDGANSLFCMPRRMKYYKGSLYVLDYNVLRKASVSVSGEVGSWQTIAGKATGIVNPKMSSGASEELLLSTVNPIDFCISEDGILLTDATQFKIMKIK